MKILLSVCLLAAFGLALPLGTSAGEAEKDQHQLAHMVFFELQERTGEAREKLVAGCRKYLSGHEGTVHFSVGTRAEEMSRDVNDRGFDVALHIVFRNKAAHDTYQKHPRHLAFIEECKGLWKSVRVFDSHLVPIRDDEAAPKRFPLPDPAAHFAGMIRAKVIRKMDGRLLVTVQEIVRDWETNRAEDPRALVGKRVVVEAPGERGDRLVPRFIESLKPGEVITIDVAHRTGEALIILELTEDQRERVR